MKHLLIGFVLGIAFVLCCGFKTGYYGPGDLSGRYSSKPSLEDIVKNQYVLAKMIENASCKD